MQTLILCIEYDGSGYAGWQRQPNALTVQECVERALANITQQKLSAVAAGRTDAGVHARGQVTHTALGGAFPVREEKIRKAINSNLPKDIRVNGAKIFKGKFNARFDAIAREYSYSLTSSDSVFLTHFATFIKYPFDPNILTEAAGVFRGEHDFTTFSKHNPDTARYWCKVEKCEWEKVEAKLWRLHIIADRFVYGMVRALTGAMIDAARKKRSIPELQTALDKSDRSLSSPLAPPQGLVLERIYYPEEIEFF